MQRSTFLRGSAVLAAILIAVFGWYLGSPFFIRTTANEPLPAATASIGAAPTVPAPATTASSATPAFTSTTTFSYRGRLQYVDGLHNGKGAVVLGVVASCCPVGDQYFMRFEDVAITNAPDVHVYLSRDKGGRWDPTTSKYIGPLKATNGSFNYDVAPGDAGEFHSVVVWCRAFSVLVTWADLEPV